jgi:hypothetical protein
MEEQFCRPGNIGEEVRYCRPVINGVEESTGDWKLLEWNRVIVL